MSRDARQSAPAEVSAREGCIPSRERLERGPVAILRCWERAPCDPCAQACPNGCITLAESVVGVPLLDEENCDGCGACITSCPAGAIFVVDLSAGEETARVWLPYERLPLPRSGERVVLLDRAGDSAGPGTVLSVRPPHEGDGTAVVCVEAPRAVGLEVVSFRPPTGAAEAGE